MTNLQLRPRRPRKRVKSVEINTYTLDYLQSKFTNWKELPVTGINVSSRSYCSYHEKFSYQFSLFSELERVEITHTNLSEIPIWFEALSRLRVLILNDNCIAVLPKLNIVLEELDITGNGISDISNIYNLINLDSLSVSDCTVDARINNLTKLEFLTLRKIKNVNEVLNVLKLNNVKTLDLTGNSLTQENLNNLTRLKNLRTLYLDESDLNESQLFEFAKASNVSMIYFDNYANPLKFKTIGTRVVQW